MTNLPPPPIMLPNGDAVAPRSLTSIRLAEPNAPFGWRVIVAFDRSGSSGSSLYVVLDVQDETSGNKLRQRLTTEWRAWLS